MHKSTSRALLAVLLAGAVGAGLVATAPPVAAATAEVSAPTAAPRYSQPEWWPLRGSNLVGCTRQSPGGVCQGHHAVWAIDVEAPAGQPVYASGAGLAKVSSNSTACSGYGKAVVVDHGSGTQSISAHLSQFSSALNGSPGGVWVDQNTVIGYIGHTGSVSNCSYNHLHYEETRNGSFGSSASDPGAFKACHGGTLVTYPQRWGASSWSGLRGHVNTARHDGTGCVAGATPAAPPMVATPGGADFDGDGFDDVFWYGTGAGPDSLWSGTAAQGGFAGSAASVNGTYKAVGGDFDGDGHHDVFWYGPGAGVDVVWSGSATRGRFEHTTPTVNGAYTPITGDFDGDGFDDVLWYASGAAADWLWSGTATPGAFSSRSVSVDGTYSAASGDFDGDGRDDILWHRPGAGADSLWSGTATRGSFARTAMTVNGTYAPITGDFDGDARADVLWYAPGSGADSLWSGTATRGSFAGSAVNVAGVYNPASGDFDGDGRDDVFWYRPGAGADPIWSGTATRGAFGKTSAPVNGTYDPVP